MTTIDIGIEGMTCASCTARVERALRKVPGVDEVTINLATERAHIDYQLPAAADAFLHAIKQAGYTPTSKEVTLAIEGMTCASCVKRIERALAAVPGVLTVHVNLATEQAVVESLYPAVLSENLVRAVHDAGYAAHLPARPKETFDAHAAARTRLAHDVEIAAFLSLPVLILAMGSGFFPALHIFLTENAPWPYFWQDIQWILTTAVIVGPGRRFFRPGFIAYRHGNPDMNSLVMTGTGAAYLYSTLVTFLPSFFSVATRHTYFDSAAIVITVILLGKYIEERAKGRAGEAMHKLIALQAPTAHLIRDGKEVVVPIDQVQSGDTMIIYPGERVATDGEVLGGTSYVDESLLTGEPIPVAKTTGDRVVGGAINHNGQLRVRVTRVGQDTVLAHIVRLVEKAQGSKLPIQGLADRVVTVFTPTVLIIAIITFITWLIFGSAPALTTALMSAVAVLIVACPCAMGLATPAAIMVGSGRAAELGVLFRNGAALETLSHVDTIVFDKTGTLTVGRPEVIESHVIDPDALLLAAAVEQGSEHPLGRAIAAVAVARGLALPPVVEFQAYPGFGVSGVVNDRHVLVGNEQLLHRECISTQALIAAAQTLKMAHKTAIFVAIDGQPAALFALTDSTRPESTEVVAAIRAMGLGVVMITGDAHATAEALGRELGITEIHSEILPAGKAQAVQSLQAEGRSVAFVGDGINDAPALAQADVGIAMQSGADIAIEAADVALRRPNLGVVVDALHMARHTLAIIRGNLFWAFFYNILLIPLAAGVFYESLGLSLNPMLAGVAMGFSSVFVISNSLRLRRIKSWVKQPISVSRSMTHPATLKTA